MALFEDNTHVFIIRVWQEPREIEAATPEWRVVIEHVPSGERRYLKELDDIITFITAYLEGMGVAPKRSWQVRQWLKRQKLPWKKQT